MQRKNAVTLIELLVVIALIALFAGLTIQHSSFLRPYIRTELDLLYQTCIYMQRRALITQQTQAIHIDPQTHSYTFNNRVRKLPKGVRFDIMSVKGPPATPTKLLEKPCTFKNNCITFYANGVIDAGSIYMTNDQRTTLYALTVAVLPYSYLRTYCYADKWLLLQ